MKRIWMVLGGTVFVVSVIVAYGLGRARAAGIPQTGTLAYSGTLLTFGQPDNNTHLIGLTLYLSAGGATTCVVAPASIQVTNGQFTVPLPESCVTIIHQNAGLQVQITIDGTAMGMEPISAVPYAVEADTASKAAAGSPLSYASQIITDTSGGTTCSIPGAIRFTGAFLQFCNGTGWLTLQSVGVYSTCASILNAGGSTGSGVYNILENGSLVPVYCDMTTDGGGWTLALNLNTSDGHVMWWGNSLWTDNNTYGSVSSPFTADYKGQPWLSYSGGTKLLLVVHENGNYLGWKSFTKTDTNTIYTDMQGNDNTLFGSAVIDTSPNNSSLFSGERMVKLSTQLFANHCVETGGTCVGGNSGSPDGDRIGSNEGTPSDNNGGGLGNWHDQHLCCDGTVGGHTCTGSNAFRTTAEAQAGWSSCSGQAGYFGTDTFVASTNTCSESNCPTANWASANGIPYDYALFIQ